MPLPFQRRASALTPTFSRDFAGLKTLDHGVGPAIDFTRGSNATFFDANGVLQTAGNNVPRFDHDPATGGASRGLLIEEARANSIRNSQAGGSTNGVIGSGGVMPTNWTAGGSGGITREVVGSGTTNGFAYVDVKYSGTNSSDSTVFPAILFEGETQIVASATQTWTGSVYVSVNSGSLSGISSIRTDIRENTAAGAYLTNSNTAHAITSVISRYSHTRTLTEATTARVAFGLFIFITGSATIDLTLRIAAPQLEQGAFPTSYIPTTGAAATRSADSAVVTPISSFYNQSEGTLFAEVNITAYGTTFPTVANINFESSDTNNFIMAFDRANTRVIYAGTGFSVGSSSITLGTHKLGAAISATAARAALNGALVGGSDASGMTMPISPTHLYIARKRTTDEPLNGHIRKLAYWPKRLTNTLLEQITT